MTLYADGIKVDKDSLGNAIFNPAVLSDDNSWYYAWTGLADITVQARQSDTVLPETPAQENLLMHTAYLQILQIRRWS